MSLQLNYATPLRPIEPRWFSLSCLIGAATAVAIAINIRDGEYWPSALLFVTLALPLCVAGALIPRVPDRGRGTLLATVFTLAAVGCQFYVYQNSPAGGWNPWSDDLSRRTVPGLALYYGGPLAAWLVALVALHRPHWRTPAVGAIVLIHVTVGVWLIRAAPSPRIDVFVFQQEAARALLDGRNPYSMTFSDIYQSTAPGERPVYGPELSNNGQLAFGFPYPPLSLYLSTAGYAATGDHRHAQLAAIALAGLLMAFMRTDWSSVAFATLFLFAPRTFFILGRGWTEPFVVLFFVATVFCAVRCRKLLPIALGLFLASKQYLVLAVPLVPLLMEGPFRWRPYLLLLVKAAGLALVVTAPFMLWDWNAFWHSLVTVQKIAPFREDALSYLVWFYHKTGIQPGVVPAFVAAGIAVTLALWRTERSPTGFAASVAMVFLVFISLNKQAFANYYYFVIGALWCALAATPPASGAHDIALKRMPKF